MSVILYAGIFGLKHLTAEQYAESCIIGAPIISIPPVIAWHAKNYREDQTVDESVALSPA